MPGTGRPASRILPAATLILILIITFAATSVAAPAAARQPPSTSPLRSDHWAYAALARLDAAGLVADVWLGGARPRSRGAVGAALHTAVLRADSAGAARAVAFAAAALERFAEEYPASVPAGGSAVPAGAALAGAITVSLADAAGGFDAGGGVALEGAISGALGRHVAFLVQPELATTGAGALTLEPARFALSGKAGGVWAYIGRDRLHLGPGSHGILLNDAVALDGVMLALDSPVRLPSLARYLGPVDATLWVSRTTVDGPHSAVLLGALRVAFSPHRAVRIAFNRSAVVAAEVDGARIGLRDVVRIPFGKHTPFDDQRASIELALRAAPAGWPVETYVESGLEDSAGAITEDPALVAGLFLPFVPPAPWLSLRYEYAAFGAAALLCGACRREPRNWYRNGPLESAYASADGEPLGHPLGGYGHEHRAQVRAWLLAARLRLSAAVWAREREPGNLLWARWPGRSRGLAVGGAWRAAPDLELSAGARGEWGEAGWRVHGARLGARAFF